METAARAIIVGALYYLAAKLSLRLALVGESVTPLWPPTGIALVGFVWFGYRIWPGVAVAAFLVNLPISPSAAAGIAAGNTLAPLFARRLLASADFRPELDRFRDPLALVILGGLISMTVSATAGTLSLLASDAIRGEDFASTWSVWWVGDAMGVLAVAPFFLSLRLIRGRLLPSLGRVSEAVVLFGALGAAAYAIDRTSRPVWVAVFPLLGWAAWRFKQRAAAPAALLVIVLATWAAAHDEGPFAGTTLLQKMVMLQIFNFAVSFTSFFFAAVVVERERAEAERQGSVERERLAQAQLYEREHRIAETLQRSLLPDQLPDIPDVQTRARYVPATGELEIGGDWYDVIPLHDGRLGLGIGDVAGHGVGAAAAMGQVRMAFRAYVLEGSAPAQTLERLNTLVHDLLPAAMTTMACAVIDLETGTLTLARAGHPAPAVRTRDGEVRYAEGGLGPPLGVTTLSTYAETEFELAPGDTLVLYTDGLIERRGESLDHGLNRLERVLSQAPQELDAACDRVVSELLDGRGLTDDVALLAVRRVPLVGRPLHLSLPARPERLTSMRQIVGRWLRLNGLSSDQVEEVLVACSEACANALQHAYDAKEGVMEIAASLQGGELTINVRDFGAWHEDSGSGTDDSSRGLTLMRGFMDSVDVDSRPDGTLVRMRCRVRESRRDG